MAASIKEKATELGDGKGGLHADQNRTPAQFPVHNQLVTFCWACDEYNEAAGSTRVVPGSHRERRHANEQEVAEEPGVVATECPAGLRCVLGWLDVAQRRRAAARSRATRSASTIRIA